MATIQELIEPSRRPSITFTLSSTDSSVEPRYLIAGGKPIVVGRASKHEGRGIQANATNAAFECPVVSREHAIIDTKWNNQNKEYEITITDNSSLHGTQVNGEPLNPHEPYTLMDGDMIEFGTNVARGNGKIRFKSCGNITDFIPDTYKGVTVVFKMDDGVDEHDGYGGYSVPSESEEESDYGDSSSEFAYDPQPESTNTSPESKKEAPRGSQEQPIDLDTFRTGSLRNVYDITTDTTSARGESKAGATTTKTEQWTRRPWEYRPTAGHTAADQVAPVQPQTLPKVVQSSHDVEDCNQREDQDAEDVYDNRSEGSIELGGEFIPYATRTSQNSDGVSADKTTIPSASGFPLPSMRVLPWDRIPTTQYSYPAPKSSSGFSMPTGFPPGYAAPVVMNTPADEPAFNTTDQAIATTAGLENVVQYVPNLMPKTFGVNEMPQAGTMTNVVESEDTLMSTAPEASAEQTHDLVINPDATTSTSNKRKREEEAVADVLAMLSEHREELRPKKKCKARHTHKPSSLLRDIRIYALGAAIGATSTFTLLASPLGGMLADWAQGI